MKEYAFHVTICVNICVGMFYIYGIIAPAYKPKFSRSYHPHFKILNISVQQNLLYRLWTVGSPFCLNSGLVCSLQKKSLPSTCEQNSLVRADVQKLFEYAQ